MRALRASFLLLVTIAAASAADLKVKVVDPQSAVVSGAQVTLFSKGSDTALKIATTSAEGIATFGELSSGSYQIQVLAPGFAPHTEDVAAARPDVITIELHLATASETVVVTATRTPAPAGESGASISTLENSQLETMEPVDANDAIRFLPGAIVSTAGQHGGLASLFVRGGNSTYNKVIIDGVPVNDPGGTFDFGVVPLAQAERIEFERGAQSTLYGSDAMTSVVQVFSRTGSTSVPELRFGADGGNLNTAQGFASLSGARNIWDYNLFGDQFNTEGKGPNDGYSDSLQGANLGVQIRPGVQFRMRTRHSNSRTGVQGEWDFNGQPLLPPDPGQWARSNNLLVGAELTVTGPSRWQHHFAGFEYNLRRTNENDITDPARAIAFDSPFHDIDNINRAGFEYQGDYSERSWARTTVGYQFEDENGFVGAFSSPTHGLRLNHAVYGQQVLQLRRLSVVAGARFVHNETFGNKAVPRVALTFLALRGGQVFSSTRLRFSYATGIKEATFDESFAGPFVLANPNLKAEQNREFEAGVEQSLVAGKYSFSALYYNNLFRDQIDFNCCDSNGNGQFVNVDKSFSQGSEVEFSGHLSDRLRLVTAYNYSSTQILAAPFCTAANFCDPLLATGQPLLRRPKHSASLLLTYVGRRWGGDVAGSFVGRRPDSDFLGLGFNHAPGYVRADLAGWYAINSRVTAYANVENALDRRYNEVVGYPALPINFRAGLRFRIGGE
jgi:vitamin B12 transporter